MSQRDKAILMLATGIMLLGFSLFNIWYYGL